MASIRREATETSGCPDERSSEIQARWNAEALHLLRLLDGGEDAKVPAVRNNNEVQATQEDAAEMETCTTAIKVEEANLRQWNSWLP